MLTLTNGQQDLLRGLETQQPMLVFWLCYSPMDIWPDCLLPSRLSLRRCVPPRSG